MSTIQPSSFLRGVLLVDAVATAATGVLLTLGASFLDDLLGLPSRFLVTVGVPLIPYAAFVAWLGTRHTTSPAVIRFIVWSNVAWVAGSVALLASRVFEPTALGVVFVVAQAIAVAFFAELQFVGLRRTLACA
jgi:hypothetical protein